MINSQIAKLHLKTVLKVLFYTIFIMNKLYVIFESKV